MIGAHVEVTQYLLSQGADVNAKTTQDLITPLHLAASFGHAAEVEVLIAGGAHPNLSTRDGLTPLYYASVSNRTPIVKILLANGANAGSADMVSLISWRRAQFLLTLPPRHVPTPRSDPTF